MESVTAREILTFDDLQPHLLLKNGNFLYKVPFRDGEAVLKVYYDSRSPLVRLQKSVANILGGQTSYQPRTRRRVELECIRLWAEHGFRVFEVYEDVEVRAPGCPPGGYRLFEYVDAPRLIHLLLDESSPAEERLALWRRFLPEWSRRHELAISLREPRLVHENGDCKHVFVLDDGDFLWFDFEMVYRSRDRVEYHVAHEILQYLWQVMRKMTPEFSARFVDATVEHYPARERLESVYRYFFRHPNPIQRTLRWLDRFRTRARKPTSKYNVARRLKKALDRSRRS